MDSARTRIEEIEKELDDAWSQLRQLAWSLSLSALECKSEKLAVISPSLRGTFLRAKAEASALEEAKRLSDEQKASLEEGQKDVSRLEKETTRTQQRLRELEGLIGAVAFAQGDSPSCDPDIAKVLSPFLDESRKISQAAERKGLGGIIGKGRRTLYERRQSEVFHSCFQALKEAGLLDRLSGERAERLCAQYNEESAVCKVLLEELGLERQKLGRKQKAISEELEKDATLDERYEEGERQLKESGVNYGLYLFDNGYKWLDESIDDSILDLIQGMLEEQNRIEECQKKIEREKEYAAIADFNSMIDFNNKKISSLKTEIATIEEEIASIEEENESIRGKIRNVEARLI